jgi:hypothetical protein
MMLKALSRREFLKTTTATLAVSGGGCAAYGTAQAAQRPVSLPMSAVQDQLRIYPAPDGEVLSRDYEVEVNGKPVPVYAIKSQWHDKKYSAAYFDFAGRVTVKIKPDLSTLNVSKSLNQLAIRPSRYGLEPTIDNGAAIFSTDTQFDISFEPAGQNSPLHLFTNPIEVDPPKPGDPNVIYFGPGIHKPTRIELTAGQTLYIAGGAVVKSAVSSTGDNIRIMGRGILCGDDWLHSKGPAARMVWPADGENILIENIIIRGAWNWTVAPSRCDRVLIRNLRICGSRCGNDDGIDPCNSSNVTIRNCFIHTDDDGIAVKGTALGNQTPRASENIVVEDCTFWIDFANGFRIGAESRATACRNFTARNIDFIHFPDRPQVAVFTIQPRGRMPMENLAFEDIRINGEQPLRLIDMTAIPPQVAYERSVVPGSGPYIHNVTFRDVSVYGWHDGPELSPLISMSALDAEHNIENVVLKNVMLHGEQVTRGTPGIQPGDFVSQVVFDTHEPETPGPDL